MVAGLVETQTVPTQIMYLDPLGERSVGRISRVVRLRRELRRIDPSVIFAHSFLPAFYARLSWGRRAKIVVVLHSASDDYESRSVRIAERILQFFTAHVVAVSASQLQQYQKRFPNFDRVSVVPNGVAFCDLRDRSDQVPTRVGCVARLASQKRPELWAAVADELSESEGLSFTWWGPGVLSDRLLASSANFAGPTPDFANVVDSIDILFSTSEREAHPIGILEALGAGIPVVCHEAVAATVGSDAPIVTFGDRSTEGASRALRICVERYAEIARETWQFGVKVRQTHGMTVCAREYDGLVSRYAGNAMSRRR